MDVLCTLGLIAFTILLEIVVHFDMEGCFIFSEQRHNGYRDDEETNPGKYEDDDSIASETTLVFDQPGGHHLVSPLLCNNQDRSHNTLPPQIEENDRDSYSHCCIPHPSTSTRTSRLFLATVIYIPTLTLFILLIRHFSRTRYVPTSPECHQYHPLPSSPQDVAGVVFLNIILFICATFAFLRSFMDAVVGKSRRTGLSYEFKVGGWWVCFPLTGAVVDVAYLWLGVCTGLKWIMVEVLIGKRMLAHWWAGSGSGHRAVGMQDGEAVRLIENHGMSASDEEGADRGSDRPPVMRRFVTMVRKRKESKIGVQLEIIPSGDCDIGYL
jgi:hypothetical protein